MALPRSPESEEISTIAPPPRAHRRHDAFCQVQDRAQIDVHGGVILGVGCTLHRAKLRVNPRIADQNFKGGLGEPIEITLTAHIRELALDPEGLERRFLGAQAFGVIAANRDAGIGFGKFFGNVDAIVPMGFFYSLAEFAEFKTFPDAQKTIQGLPAAIYASTDSWIAQNEGL